MDDVATNELHQPANFVWSAEQFSHSRSGPHPFFIWQVPGEILVARQLSNGYTVTWSTPDAVEDAFSHCRLLSPETPVSAHVRVAGRFVECDSVRALRVVIACDGVESVKLVTSTFEDVVVFNTGVRGEPNLLAVQVRQGQGTSQLLMRPPSAPDYLASMLEASSTPWLHAVHANVIVELAGIMRNPATS